MNAELQQHWKSGQYFLVINNSGSSAARNIEIKLNENPIDNCSFTINPRCNPEIIGAGSNFKYILYRETIPEKPIIIEIHWQDNSRQNGRYSTTLGKPNIQD